MTDTVSGARRWPARRRSWLFAGLALALLTSGCLQDGTGTGPSSGAARLAVTASVAGSAGSAVAVTGLGVEVRFLRSAGDPVLLLSQTIPLSGVAPGGIVTQPLSIDLGACLADPAHLPGGGSCTVMVRVTLLAGSAALDVVTIGPLTLRPGETADPAEVTLHTVGTLAVTPGTPGTLYTGEELQLTAALTDATGAVVEDRVVGWTTSAPSVATVDAGGKVTAVAQGSAIITASGGDRTMAITVRVVPRASILVDHEAINFDGRRTGPVPQAQSVHVVNGATGNLDDLSLGPIVYASDVADWLDVTLSGTTAPATLTLRPSRTELPPGIHYATVWIQAPSAENRRVSVLVSYTVTAATLLAVDRSLVEITGTPWDSLHTSVGITAAGPLDGLVITDLSYGPYASGWLTARLSSGSAPSDLSLAINGTLYPGIYQADVKVSAPGAANDALVQLLWTVPRESYELYTDVYPCEIFVGDSAYVPDSVYISAYAYSGEDDYWYSLDGAPFSIRSLGPGLTLASVEGVTGGSGYIGAALTPGFLGEARVEVTLGQAPHAPGALSDTVTVLIQDSDPDQDPYCYGEGGIDARAPYTPGAPNLRRSPGALRSAPAVTGPTPPRARRTTPASAAPASTVRSRFTPEHH